VIILPTNEFFKLQQELITNKSKHQAPLIIKMEEKPTSILNQ